MISFKKFNEAWEEWESLVEKDGLWDNIRQKKARMKSGSGEKKAKPGDKDYPKTLNVEQSYNNMANKPLSLIHISEPTRPY